MNRIRVTFVLTHPIQYYTPWFRHIVASAPEIDLTVVYATEPTPEQQGVGFGRPFKWDVSLTDGHKSIIARPAQAGDRVDSAQFYGLNVPEIADAVISTAPDVVAITGWYSVTLLRALAACRRRHIPVLYRGDSHLLSGPKGLRRPVWLLKTWLLLKQFDAFLVPGRRVHHYLRWFGMPEHRLFDVPHSIDNDRFAESAKPFQSPAARAASRRKWQIAEDAFVPLFVGKLLPSKRPLNAVRAVAKLGRNTTLLVAGSGELEQAMKVEAARVGTDLRIVGFLNQTELPEAYAAADCLILPSDFPETWGLVVNEAFATGLPAVVSAAVGCAPDLITDDETGYVYALDDVDGLANRLTKVREKKAARHDWRPACQARIAQFSYAQMTTGLVRACRAVLRHSIGRRPAPSEASERILALCGQMVIVGGLERMIFRMLRAMTEAGAQAHCIVNDWENFRITPLAEESGASWSVGPYWYTITRRRLTPTKIATMIWEIVRVSSHMLSEARRMRATHVVVPDHVTALRNAPALAWLRMRGVVTIVAPQNAPAHGRFYRFIWRRLVDPLTTRYVCNSSFTERELLAHGIDPSKVSVIPNVVSPRATAWHSGRPRIDGRIIYVGQVIPEKGLDRLLDAVALLRAEGRPATLDVVVPVSGWEAPGHEGYYARIRERAAAPDLAGAVRLLGWREDVPELMSEASIHCCPSLPEIREAFGLVVLEAKLSGLPSVVTPSGYLPELVEHQATGWVCKTATAEAIAEGLRFFVADRERTREAGAAAVESARAFSVERFARMWEDVFHVHRENSNAAVAG